MRISCLRIIVAATMVAGSIFSCARQETISVNELEQAAFDEWIKENVPNAMPLSHGIYYVVLEEAPDGAPAIEAGNWVEVEMELLDIQDNIIYTRSQETAERLRSFTKYTHYVPDFFIIASSAETNSTILAQFRALSRMKLGDVWRIYAPSSQINNSSEFSNTIGYGGQFTLPANRPGILDNLRILSITKDPDVREQEFVKDRAIGTGLDGFGMERWNLTEADTVASTSRHFFRQFLNTERAELRDTIEMDSTIRVYYTGRFLDGFIFDTNIDSIWVNHFGGKRHNSEGTLVDDTTALSITRSADIATTMPDKMITLMFGEDREEMKLRYNDVLRIVATSPYAFGDTGRVGYKTSSTASSQSYNYNSSYYNYGGYSYYDSSYYDYYNSYLYGYYDTSSTSSETFPIAEIKPFTPVIYDFVILRPEGAIGKVD